MKKNILILICLINYFSFGQLINCRPKVCLIDYNFHNDALPNADKTAIINARPDILIDNTPGGYWGGVNGGVGCLPQYYTPLGIQVFSYIAGGYEGTIHPISVSGLTQNIARVNAIDLDNATGVFLDEVTGYPDNNDKEYIIAIYNQCQANGLKLILNPGQYSFDPWLMNYCDYILTDELYDGTRTPSASESPFLDRVLVVNQGVTSANNATAITNGAHSNGFGYSYACFEYINLPSWLQSYMTLILQTPPAPPIITQIGNTIQSNIVAGNQWYEITQGLIIGATSQIFTPTTVGTYYSINTQSGCSTSPSNTININTLDSVTIVNSNNEFIVFPNPVDSILNLRFPNDTIIDKLTVTDSYGKAVLIQNGTYDYIDILNLADGLYILKAYSSEQIFESKFIKK